MDSALNGEFSPFNVGMLFIMICVPAPSEHFNLQNIIDNDFSIQSILTECLDCAVIHGQRSYTAHHNSNYRLKCSLVCLIILKDTGNYI